MERRFWRNGQEPSEDDIEKRRRQYHAPYHRALEAQIARIKGRYGFAVLYDCHSIRSVIPHLFDGRLPDFNIGTNGGVSCAETIQGSVADDCREAGAYSNVFNGRFSGGWTTRHYGQPDRGVHAVQMELAQTLYMQESTPWTYEEEAAKSLRIVLKRILRNVEILASDGRI